jgi:hypothetical protein
MLLQLIALEFAIGVWKVSIDLSKKLRPGTWILLAILNTTISATAFYLYKAESMPASAIPPVNVLCDVQQLPPDFPEWHRKMPPTVVEVSESETLSLLATIEKRVALATSVITALLAIVNLFLALQAFRTFKAEKELKELQLAHLRLEVQKLKIEIEEAKREREKSTGIILTS